MIIDPRKDINRAEKVLPIKCRDTEKWLKTSMLFPILRIFCKTVSALYFFFFQLPLKCFIFFFIIDDDSFDYSDYDNEDDGEDLSKPAVKAKKRKKRDESPELIAPKQRSRRSMISEVEILDDNDEEDDNESEKSRSNSSSDDDVYQNHVSKYTNSSVVDEGKISRTSLKSMTTMFNFFVNSSCSNCR